LQCARLREDGQTASVPAMASVDPAPASEAALPVETLLRVEYDTIALEATTTKHWVVGPDYSERVPVGRPIKARTIALATTQVANLLDAVPLLVGLDTEQGHVPTLDGHEVITVSMASPLAFLIKLPADSITALGRALVTLLDDIATSPVRVTRKWKEEMLRIERIDQERELLRKARAATIARIQIKEANGVRPSSVEIFDGVAPEGDLEAFDGWADVA